LDALSHFYRICNVIACGTAMQTEGEVHVVCAARGKALGGRLARWTDGLRHFISACGDSDSRFT
jgi:hypothetical protein